MSSQQPLQLPIRPAKQPTTRAQKRHEVAWHVCEICLEEAQKTCFLGEKSLRQHIETDHSSAPFLHIRLKNLPPHPVPESRPHVPPVAIDKSDWHQCPDCPRSFKTEVGLRSVCSGNKPWRAPPTVLSQHQRDTKQHRNSAPQVTPQQTTAGTTVLSLRFAAAAQIAQPDAIAAAGSRQLLPVRARAIPAKVTGNDEVQVQHCSQVTCMQTS